MHILPFGQLRDPLKASEAGHDSNRTFLTDEHREV